MSDFTRNIFFLGGFVFFTLFSGFFLEFQNPQNAANWFHAFQSHLFELQMEQLK